MAALSQALQQQAAESGGELAPVLSGSTIMVISDAETHADSGQLGRGGRDGGGGRELSWLIGLELCSDFRACQGAGRAQEQRWNRGCCG